MNKKLILIIIFSIFYFQNIQTTTSFNFLDTTKQKVFCILKNHKMHLLEGIAVALLSRAIYKYFIYCKDPDCKKLHKHKNGEECTLSRSICLETTHKHSIREFIADKIKSFS